MKEGEIELAGGSLGTEGGKEGIDVREKRIIFLKGRGR